MQTTSGGSNYFELKGFKVLLEKWETLRASKRWGARGALAASKSLQPIENKWGKVLLTAKGCSCSDWPVRSPAAGLESIHSNGRGEHGHRLSLDLYGHQTTGDEINSCVLAGPLSIQRVSWHWLRFCCFMKYLVSLSLPQYKPRAKVFCGCWWRCTKYYPSLSCQKSPHCLPHRRSRIKMQDWLQTAKDWHIMLK